jgi:hypothetical protein
VRSRRSGAAYAAYSGSAGTTRTASNLSIIVDNRELRLSAGGPGSGIT